MGIKTIFGAMTKKILGTRSHEASIEEMNFVAMSKTIHEEMCGEIVISKVKHMIYKEKGLEELGIKQSCFEAISKMTKIEALSHETSLEVMGFKKTFFEAMDKNIFGVNCFEHLG